MTSDTDTGYVYTLTDPRSGDPKYVGATVNPNQRYQTHLDNPHSEELAAWVQELAEKNMTPTMTIVQIDDVDGLATAERRVLNRIAEEHDVLNNEMNPSYTRAGRWASDTADIPPGSIEPAEIVTKTVNDNGQIYVGRDLGGKEIVVAYEVVDDE